MAKKPTGWAVRVAKGIAKHHVLNLENHVLEDADACKALVIPPFLTTLVFREDYQLTTVFDEDTDLDGYIGGDDFVAFSDCIEIRKRYVRCVPWWPAKAVPSRPELLSRIAGFGSIADLVSAAVGAKLKAKELKGRIQIVRNGCMV